MQAPAPVETSCVYFSYYCTLVLSNDTSDLQIAFYIRDIYTPINRMYNIALSCTIYTDSWTPEIE